MLYSYAVELKDVDVIYSKVAMKISTVKDQ
jgi:hypothetical protein